MNGTIFQLSIGLPNKNAVVYLPSAYTRIYSTETIAKTKALAEVLFTVSKSLISHTCTKRKTHMNEREKYMQETQHA